jgi:lysylphosphatidylglycerol synthetase-like protein (DUF2156 family)
VSYQPLQSPFGQRKPIRISFSMMMLLMMMVVAVGATMLLVFALRVPAFSSELRAYVGMPELPADTASSRKAHLIFLLYLYSAPLGLGILVYIVHFAADWVSRYSKPPKEDPEFEMDAQGLNSGMGRRRS